jgi:PAS domain S-box-containing protein
MSSERLIGYTAEEVVGKNYSIFFSEDELRRNATKRALATAAKKGSFTAEGIRIRKDGSHFWARSFLTLVKASGYNPKLYVLITQDISRTRAIEQRREEYIGIASHELKNPITTLSLFSELLAKRLQLDRDKENLHMLRDIQAQAARLVALVDDLLIVGKLEGDKLELHQQPFNPNVFVKKIVQDFRNSSASHRIIFKGKASREVHADKDRITQVLINLITNAIKYSPRATKVLVSVEYHNKKCVISVQDFGQGISKQDQREIFTRFFRTGYAETSNIAGSGLGLYISKGIMKSHHQRLWVESIMGKGSTFFFTLSLS